MPLHDPNTIEAVVTIGPRAIVAATVAALAAAYVALKGMTAR